MYKLIHGKEPVIRLSDGKIIASDSREYRDYLKWAETNAPAPADVPVKIKKPPITIESLADALVRKGVLTENEVRGNAK